jgi:hypothetical protein
MIASTSEATTPVDCAMVRTRPRGIRSATMPANGPTIIRGAERAKAATPTMNGEPVICSASQPSVTRSTQRAMLTTRPEAQSRR